MHGKPFGALPVTQTWIWTASFLSARPVRAHVLVLGLGTGTVLRTLVDDPDVRYIDVVDWSRELPILLSQEPMRSMTGRALDSEKVHFHTTDARTAVALAQTGFYDAVYESLTHYGPVGSTYYRSLEYYREVHRVLAPHGVLISVGVARGDDDVFVTALSVFHRVTWFEPFCIIAGDDPQLIDDARLAKVVEERRTLIGEMASPLLDAPRIEKHMGDLLDRACVRDDDLAGEFALGPKRETRARRCAREE